MKALANVNATAIVGVEYFSTSVIDEFIASRHASENTNRTYRNALNQLIKFFAQNHISTPQESDVDNFVNTLKASKKSAATLRLYTTVTKSFFSFTARKAIYPNVAADVTLKLRKTNTHSKRALTNEQAQKLLASVEGNDVLAKRDRAILALALTCGLRTCEISRANVGNLRADAGGGYLDVQGKGRLTADATVKIAPKVFSLLQSYLEMRGELADDSPLFISESRQNRGVRLSVQSVQKMIKRRLQAAGVYAKNAVTPHSCRHFAATCALKGGVDVREVSAMLRHSSLNVTLVYAHDISLETRRAENVVADSLFTA